MPFKQKYFKEDVENAIKENSDLITAAGLATYMKCSLQTVNKLLAELKKDKKVVGVNRGSDANPTIIWSRTAKSIADVRVIE